jgi:YVTN family beta-propeller protein
VANNTPNNVSVIDTATNTVIGSPIPVDTKPVAFGVFIGPPRKFAGMPGFPNCYDKTISELAKEYGGLNAASKALGYSDVMDLRDAVVRFCRG